MDQLWGLEVFKPAILKFMYQVFCIDVPQDRFTIVVLDV